MKIDLEFAHLHGPLFITHDNGGTNFGEKIYIDQRKNLKGKLDALYYDTDLRHTVVVYKGKVSMIENVSSATLVDPSQIGVKIPKVEVPAYIARVSPPPAPVKAQVGGPEKFQAQVSTPHDKVQGKPGRKAKYQGEESQGE